MRSGRGIPRRSRAQDHHDPGRAGLRPRASLMPMETDKLWRVKEKISVGIKLGFVCGIVRGIFDVAGRGDVPCVHSGHVLSIQARGSRRSTPRWDTRYLRAAMGRGVAGPRKTRPAIPFAPTAVTLVTALVLGPIVSTDDPAACSARGFPGSSPRTGNSASPTPRSGSSGRRSPAAAGWPA